MAKIGINIATGSIQQQEIIVGIDLGTTNSLIAIMHPDTKKPIALKDIDGATIVPSIIHFNENGSIDVGINAKEKLISDSTNTIFSIKRFIGKSFNEIEKDTHFFAYQIVPDETDNEVKIKVNDTLYSPILLSSYILKSLKERAEHILKTPVNKAVVTVPAYFNDVQRQATREAGKLAGLEIIRIINEPTAASLAYGIGLDKNIAKKIAVYDLGGGTFDISILQIEDGVFEVLSTNGDTFLGGDDIDNLIIEFWENKYNFKKINLPNPQLIRIVAEFAKKELSNSNHFNLHDFMQKNPPLDFNFLDININVQLTVTELNTLITPFINKTIQCCTNALLDATLNIADIDEIIMVGGSTRIPFVKSSLTTFFNKQVNDHINPDEVVAIGAAIQADILSGNNNDLLLLDITPLSLGIETIGGLMDVLIPRNSKIPTKTGRQYTTQQDGQTGIVIHVYQGERDLVKYNRSLGSFTLKGIPNMPAGFPKIEIIFQLDADGILVVKATELRTGLSQQIEIDAKQNLTDEEVEKNVLDSLINAQEDIAARALIEAISEANQLIEVTEKFIKKNIDIFMDDELKNVQYAIDNLKKSIQENDKIAIQSNQEKLNSITTPFAERSMNTAIYKALKGKKI